jgi:hypothetical protein
MSLIHLQNQVVFKRELALRSWSTYISYELDEGTHEIIAETISVFHDRERPQCTKQTSRGRFRIPLDEAPPGLVHQVEELLDLPNQCRETIATSQRDTTILNRSHPAMTVNSEQS